MENVWVFFCCLENVCWKDLNGRHRESEATVNVDSVCKQFIKCFGLSYLSCIQVIRHPVFPVFETESWQPYWGQDCRWLMLTLACKLKLLKQCH